MKGKISIGGLFLLSSVANAAGWTPELSVKSVFTEAKTDLIVIYTADGSIYTQGCAANSWIFPADTDARRGRAYSTVMAAAAGGKKIKLWYSDTCSSWSYHEATAVMLVQ